METSRKESLKFFGTILAECTAWKQNKDLVEDTTSKSIVVFTNEVKD